MKKKVNGQIVNIDNIEVFEKATEGLAVNRTTTNMISDTTGIDFSIVESCIDAYSNFYKSLPFPLYALDNDIKYATLGNYLKKVVDKVEKVWVSSGLYVCIDEKLKVALHFVNYSWGLVRVESIKEDNTNIQLYKDECGFVDMIWAYGKITKKESTSGYYKEFMGEFLKACNNQPMVLKWELGNILDFGNVPTKLSFTPNKILDVSTKSEYIMDIFVTGIKESKQKQHLWSLCDELESDVSSRQKIIKQYGFEVYEKVYIKDEDIKPGEDKIRKCQLFGAVSIFNSLSLIRNVNEQSEFQDYQGLIIGDSLVYLICGRLFLAKANKYVEPKEIARGVELYSYNNSMVFFTKSQLVSKGVKKETIYSYSLKDNSLRLCRIQFING